MLISSSKTLISIWRCGPLLTQSNSVLLPAADPTEDEGWPEQQREHTRYHSALSISFIASILWTAWEPYSGNCVSLPSLTIFPKAFFIKDRKYS